MGFVALEVVAIPLMLAMKNKSLRNADELPEMQTLLFMLVLHNYTKWIARYCSRIKIITFLVTLLSITFNDVINRTGHIVFQEC